MDVNTCDFLAIYSTKKNILDELSRKLCPSVFLEKVGAAYQGAEEEQDYPEHASEPDLTVRLCISGNSHGYLDVCEGTVNADQDTFKVKRK